MKYTANIMQWEELCKSICKIIQENDGEELEVTESFNRLKHIHNDNFETEFRMVEIGGTLTVSRVQFQKQRNGCMTKCIKELIKFAQETGVDKIVIQSVLTKEMSSCCRKNGFEPVPTASAFDFGYGFTMGDYYLNVAE